MRAAVEQENDRRDLGRLVRAEVEKTLARSVKGLQFITTPDPEVGITPREEIHRRGTLRLYHYLPQTDEVYRVPVLLVMSLISKPYILDLAPGQSMVEFLLRRGFDVYMVDWGVPRPEDRQLRLEDYALDRLPDCIDRVLAHSGEEELSIAGYCMGGLISLLYAALNERGPLRSLACLATPVDFDGMELFKSWTDEHHFDVDRIVDRLGNVPPSLLYASFYMLRPLSPAANRLRLWDNMWNDEYVQAYRRFDRWAADQIPFPGECFRQSVKELQRANKLVAGELELARRHVDLEAVRVPLLHVLAEHDHIVPYPAAHPLIDLVGSQDKQEIVLKGGHVSLVAGANAIFRLWPQLEQWLAPRSE